MEEPEARQEQDERSTRTARAAIPPQERQHLTESTWIEEMIHYVGVYLGEKPKDESNGEEAA